MYNLKVLDGFYKIHTLGENVLCPQLHHSSRTDYLQCSLRIDADIQVDLSPHCYNYVIVYIRSVFSRFVLKGMETIFKGDNYVKILSAASEVPWEHIFFLLF